MWIVPGSELKREDDMTGRTDAIEQLVADLRDITTATRDPREIVAQVGPLVRDLALAKSWLEAKHYDCDPRQGFGAHLLHEEQDHALAIFAGAWLPGRGAPPHNHGTWAVVAGVIGAERNTLWTRVDDGSRLGYAEVCRQEDRTQHEVLPDSHCCGARPSLGIC
jgi:predicted metal-dependent enzyme (double-stranded beta helix superfamily)